LILTRLIAIMLGRLEMTIEECIERFCTHLDAIFNHARLSARLTGRLLASKYNADKITQATRRLVGDLDPTPDYEKWKRNVFGAPHGRCKT
jgi:hypothetical protein